MDLLSTGLAVQLVALLALAGLLLTGPPPPRRALRARSDGGTEVVEDDSDGRTWRALVRLAVAVLLSGTALSAIGLGNG